MSKPIEPKRPAVPEILKCFRSPEWEEPQEYLEETLYKTPTLYEIELEKFKAKNPKASLEETSKYFLEEFNWDVEYDENGNIDRLAGGDYDISDDPNTFKPNAHSNSGSDPVPLMDILSKVSKKDYANIRMHGIAHYKGDYIWGDPGLRVYILRKNPNYEEQMKAHKKYKRQCKKYNELWYQYNRDLKAYEAEREVKIKAKIKELEDSGEI